jgi:hypothetical protein
MYGMYGANMYGRNGMYGAWRNGRNNGIVYRMLYVWQQHGRSMA